MVIIRDIFCKFCINNICCDPKSEPSCRDCLDEWSQHMVLMRNKKNNHQIVPLI